MPLVCNYIYVCPLLGSGDLSGSGSGSDNGGKLFSVAHTLREDKADSINISDLVREIISLLSA